MTNDIAVRPLVYNGEIIAQRDTMVSLTDMWKASGSDPSRTPFEWLRQEASKRFVEFLADSIGNPEPGKNQFGLVAVKRGGSERGVTFAHWQIALAYAKYLSPEFHVWCNTVVRERMEGGRAQGAVSVAELSAEVRKVVGGITKAVVHSELNLAITTLIPSLVAAQLAEHNYMVRQGKTAGQLWARYDLPRFKSASKWFGNRLVEMGCMIEGRGERGGMAIRLFDPDKVETVMKNGLMHRVRTYISERQGQKKLRLVSPIVFAAH